MKIKLRINDRWLLLEATQLQQILDIVEGVEMFDEKYVGDYKGYTGHSNCYEYDFKPFDPNAHLTFGVMTEREIDKYKTLNAMRRAATEGE